VLSAGDRPLPEAQRTVPKSLEATARQPKRPAVRPGCGPSRRTVIGPGERAHTTPQAVVYDRLLAGISISPSSSYGYAGFSVVGAGVQPHPYGYPGTSARVRLRPALGLVGAPTCVAAIAAPHAMLLPAVPRTLTPTRCHHDSPALALPRGATTHPFHSTRRPIRPPAVSP
jgi:hypothetical protein